MTTEELVILLNFVLLLFGQLAIIHSISKKKQVLLILSITAIVSVYSAYLALGQLEGTTLKVLLIILSCVLWLTAGYQLSSLYFSVSQKIKVNYPTKMLMRLLNDLITDRGYTVLKSNSDSISFSTGSSAVDADVYQFLRSKYLEINVTSNKRLLYNLFIDLMILAFVPLAYALYIESPYIFTVSVSGYAVPLHIAYLSVFFLLALWLIAKRIRITLVKDTATVWSDIIVRIRKLDEAMKVVEGIERAKIIAEQMRREKIREALEIAKGLEVAKEFLKKKEQEKES